MDENWRNLMIFNLLITEFIIAGSISRCIIWRILLAKLISPANLNRPRLAIIEIQIRLYLVFVFDDNNWAFDHSITLK